MALGNLDIANFEPKRSRTAASLLTAAPQKDEKKTKRMEIRIREDLKLLFEEFCTANKTDVSSAIRTYIEDTLLTGTLGNKSARFDLYGHNVRTDTVLKTSRGFSAFGELNLRNKEEREAWLNNFKSWGVWLDVPKANKKFYRYDLKNGCAIIVEVGAAYTDWTNGTVKEHEQTTYAIIDEKHQKFNSSGDSFTMVIQWLTKYSKEI